MTFWSRGVDRSRGKLKPLYLHYQRVYGHQTWQDGNLPWHLWIHDPLTTWSCEIMWQTKIIIFPLPKFLWPPNLAKWQPILIDTCLLNHMILWSCGLVRSRNNLKSLYHYSHSAFGHQTWQAGDLQWGDSNHNVTPPFSHVVSRDHVIN